MRSLPSSQTYLIALVCASIATTASAQERLDSSVRAWADITFYDGELVFEGLDAMSVAPVVRGELELSMFQLGLDLPFAFGVTTVDPDLASTGSGVGARMGSPTLHVDYLIEERLLRVAAGLALAIPTNDGEDESSGEVASGAGAFGGLVVRGLWNIWWYLEDAWALVVPASVDVLGDGYELGVEGALGWVLRNADRPNSGVMQLGTHAAAIFDPLLIGLRLTGVMALDRRLFSFDRFQLSTELYAELRLPPGWLAAGLSIPLDEPLGVLGDGAAGWGVRVAGGAGF